MSERPAEYSQLAEEIVELVLSKVHRLPKEENSLVVIAAIEAIAWIAATETNNHCREKGKDSDAAMERAEEYSKLFASRVHHDLAETYKG